MKINIVVCGQFDMDFSPYFDSQGMAASRAAHLPHILRASRQMTVHFAPCTRAYSFEDMKRTVTFVSNYADDHGLVMPGRVPGFKRDDIKLMPSSDEGERVQGLPHGLGCDSS